MKSYRDFAVDETVKILSVDSPTGYTKEAGDLVADEFAKLGFPVTRTRKNGVVVELGGEGEPILLEAHLDTLGAIVSEIKGNGRLKLSPLGGLKADNTETENCRVVTRFNGVYEGTIQLVDPSIHVNVAYSDTPRNFDTVEVVLDEDVKSVSDVKALGINTGDIVCVEPRTRVTKSGYIKSRFLDDKLSVGILLGFAKYVAEKKNLSRKVYLHITTYEEVGHGGSASVPADVVEAISVDMGCVGSKVTCTERQVSICAKDSGGPYDYDVVTGLVLAAKKMNADYSVDIYPAYGSDVEATLRAGNDLKHGLIGSGVYASHGYERSHVDGVENTLKVLVGYLCK